MSLKVRDTRFMLAQLLVSPYLRVFALVSETDHWVDIDPDREKVLFEVTIGNVVLSELVASVIDEKTVTPSHTPLETLRIKPKLNFDGGYPLKGGNLIDIGD